MLKVFRLFGLLLLCFALVAGGVSTAVARGQAAALTKGGVTLVICSGYGVLTVMLDDQGNPVRATHPCPECLAGLGAYLPLGPTAIVPIARPSEKAMLLEPAAQPGAAGALNFRARGPPLLG